MPSVELLINASPSSGGCFENRLARDHATAKLKRHQSQVAKLVIAGRLVLFLHEY